MIVSCIAAMAENRVIGRGNALPWHLPSDLRHFRRVTLGHPVIMGRKTYEAVGKPLPGRTSIVVTRRPAYRAAEGIVVVHSLGEALERCRGAGEVFVIGGAELFGEALEVADRLYLTVIHADVEGDTRFPDFDPGRWKLVREERREADDKNAYEHSFLLYERAERTVPGACDMRETRRIP